MLSRLLSLYAALLALTCSLAAVPAAGQESDRSAAQEVRLVVQLQLDAFSEDDAEKAFSLATEATQTLAGTPGKFLHVIKQQFKPIYRHRDALFSEPEIIGPHALQVVQLTDHDNLVWIAIYQVELERDGAWKVDGCQLFETSDMSI